MGEETSTAGQRLSQTLTRYVLVHGICGGGWCWYKIKCLMENFGYRVTCIDLKASGINHSEADSILSFEDYNQPLIDFLSGLPETEQVILVGHSAGGLSVTHASRRFPKKIRLAVYLAASMLKVGYSTEQDVKDGAPDLSQSGDVFQLGFGLGPDKPPTSAIIKEEFQRKIFFPMSSQEDSALASLLLRPGPILAILSAKFEQDQHAIVENVPRVYIKTMRDKVLKPEQQEAMIRRWPPMEVHLLDSDHSPFFSNPYRLAGLLSKSAASVGCN